MGERRLITDDPLTTPATHTLTHYSRRHSSRQYAIAKWAEKTCAKQAHNGNGRIIVFLFLSPSETSGTAEQNDDDACLNGTRTLIIK